MGWVEPRKVHLEMELHFRNLVVVSILIQASMLAQDSMMYPEKLAKMLQNIQWLKETSRILINQHLDLELTMLKMMR
jgi:hypothetical protein